MRSGAVAWLRPGLVIAAVFLLLPSCRAPDHPPLRPAELPEGVVEAVGPATVRSLSAGPGVTFFHLRAVEGPWAIHLLRLDLERCELGLQVLRAPKQDDMAGGRSPVTAMLEGWREGTHREVVAGVNGDFFTPQGLPVGTEVVSGDVRRVGTRPAFAWRPGRDPWMGVPEVLADTAVMVGWVVPRDRADGMSQVVGGFPLLLRGGERVGDLGVAKLPGFSGARHPRTAVGYDAREDALWIAVVDGRQPGYSDGMTLPELTRLLEELGAWEAVNLDGGGSSVMIVEGVAVSRPSDEAGERPVVNALAVVRSEEFCRRTP